MGFRICYLGDARSIHVKRWIDWFSKRHETYLITYHEPEILRGYENLYYMPIGKGALRYLRFLNFVRWSKSVISKIKPDIIHAHYVVNYGLCGAYSGFHPFVLFPWGDDISVFPEVSPLHRFYVVEIMKRADAIIGYEDEVERINALLGEEKGRVVRDGIDVDLFKPADAKRKGGKIRILNLRKSEGDYHTEVLVKAIPLVTKVYDDVEFVMLRAGKEFSKLYELAKELGVLKYIKFVEPMPNERVPELMRSCDIYVDTFFRRVPGSGLGKTGLEAMSCGMAVVVSNTSGIGTYVKDGENGLIYRGLDPSSLAEALIRLIEDEKLREALGRRARKHVVENYNIEDCMRTAESLYEELLA